MAIMLLAVLAVLMLSQHRGIRSTVLQSLAGMHAATPEHDEPSAKGTVFLTVNLANGKLPQTESANWHEGMTVLDLLQQEPRISVRCQGAGAAAFVMELNGLSNEGANGKNWTYSVNGRQADKSCGACPLQPNDHVLWIFAGPQ